MAAAPDPRQQHGGSPSGRGRASLRPASSKPRGGRSRRGFFGQSHTRPGARDGRGGGSPHPRVASRRRGSHSGRPLSPVWRRRRRRSACHRLVYVLLEILLRPPLGVGILLPTFAEVPDLVTAGLLPAEGARHADTGTASPGTKAPVRAGSLGEAWGHGDRPACAAPCTGPGTGRSLCLSPRSPLSSPHLKVGGTPQVFWSGTIFW